MLLDFLFFTPFAALAVCRGQLEKGFYFVVVIASSLRALSTAVGSSYRAGVQRFCDDGVASIRMNSQLLRILAKMINYSTFDSNIITKTTIFPFFLTADGYKLSDNKLPHFHVSNACRVSI